MIKLHELTPEEALKISLKNRYYGIGSYDIHPLFIRELSINRYNSADSIMFNFLIVNIASKVEQTVTINSFPNEVFNLYESRKEASVALIEKLKSLKLDAGERDTEFIDEYLNEFKLSYPDQFI